MKTLTDAFLAAKAFKVGHRTLTDAEKAITFRDVCFISEMIMSEMKELAIAQEEVDIEKRIVGEVDAIVDTCYYLFSWSASKGLDLPLGHHGEVVPGHCHAQPLSTPVAYNCLTDVVVLTWQLRDYLDATSTLSPEEVLSATMGGHSYLDFRANLAAAIANTASRLMQRYANATGVCPLRVFSYVAAANLRKLHPETLEPLVIRPSDGKIMKPEGWVGPEPEIHAYVNSKLQGTL